MMHIGMDKMIPNKEVLSLISTVYTYHCGYPLGSVEHITFYYHENGYTVLPLRPEH